MIYKPLAFAGVKTSTEESIKGNKKCKKLLTDLSVLYRFRPIHWKCSGRLELKKKNPYNHFYSTEVKSKGKKIRDHAIIKSLILGSPKWSALHKTFIKNECHSTNNLHALCKKILKLNAIP